jgi:hypothetical protein
MGSVALQAAIIDLLLRPAWQCKGLGASNSALVGVFLAPWNDKFGPLSQRFLHQAMIASVDWSQQGETTGGF